MEVGTVMQIFRDAMFTALLLALPVLLTSLAVGLIIAILQAATQVHEQTLTFVPKLVTIALMLFILGPWMITIITDFIGRLFDTIIILV